MNKCYFRMLFVISILFTQTASAQFDLIPLGIFGGVNTNNMTSFLVKDSSKKQYLALDAGTIASGLSVALQKGSIHTEKHNTNQIAYAYRNLIDSYWISHGHLDHIAGLIALSPEDSKKNIYGIQTTISTLKNDYFNWETWPNMTNEGNVPLNQYYLNEVNIIEAFDIGKTGLSGIALSLDHGINPITKKGYPSSALLVSNSNKERIVFFGDTGPDKEQNSSKLEIIWQYLSTYIKNKEIKAIIIECSYPNSRKTSELYGHLNPKTLVQELTKLETYSGGKGSLNSLKIFIIHVKPSADKTGEENYNIIMDELKSENTFGIEFIRPVQGELYTIK